MSLRRASLIMVVLAMTSLTACGGSRFVGQWTDDQGKPLPSEQVEGEGFVVDSWVVSGHCDWESAVFLLISWPPGRVDADWVTSDIDDGTVRLYVRDPEGLFQGNLLGQFSSDSTLAPGSEPGGVHMGYWEVWVSPSGDEETIQLVGPDRIERWQRAEEFIACA